MKTKFTKKGRRILSAALCLLMMITALPMSAFVRGERPVMDFKYDIMKHPNVRLTTDGGKPPYIHGEPTQAVATLVFDSDIPKNAVSVKAVSTSYELLSNEDLEEIFNI